jgi:uncharacterized protein (TIGR02301 family)
MARLPAPFFRRISTAKMVFMRVPAVLLLLIAATLVPEPASAQSWFPWFGGGYRPSRPVPGGVFDTLRPFGTPGVNPPAAKKDANAPNAAKPTDTPPPYEGDFSRLAEILGALHYLGPLCGEKEKERWRGEMQGLLESEQPTADRRDRLVGSFNRGYQSYEQTYRNCTPAADVVIKRFLDEGARLSRDIATRYGN